MQNQVYTFAVFILNGLIIGLLFDTFRILRKSFKTSTILTNIQDIIFWILSGLIIIYSIFTFTNGTLRLYIFLGIIFGYLLYLLIFSKIYIKTSVCIIKFIKTIIHYTIVIPLIFIYKIISKIIFTPLKFIYNKFLKKVSKPIKKIIKKGKKMMFNSKIFPEKKDFA